MLELKTAKTHRGRRILEKRAPKIVENEKKTLFVHGTKTSNVLNSVLTELYHLKKENSVKYTRRNDKIRPFEAGGETNLEFFSQKTDCALFVAGYSSPTQSTITEELQLSEAEFSLFGSILTFGATIGAISSGFIADFLGRVMAMRVYALFCTAGWLAIYLSKSSLALHIGRLTGGYGMGAFSFVVPIYIAEISPVRLRGALTTLHQVMISTGISIAFVVGIPLSWRTLALMVGVEADEDRLQLFFDQVSGKDITELVAAGREKLASVPSGGGAVAVSAAPAAGAGAAAAEAPKHHCSKRNLKESP